MGPTDAPGAPFVSFARHLAASHPEAMLPCPACAASVKGQNLDRHLGKSHPGLGVGAVSPPPERLVWVGTDRRIYRTLAFSAVFYLVSSAAMALLWQTGFLVYALVGVLLLLGVAALALAGKLRARLSIDAARVRVEHSFGLLTHEVALPAKVEVGSLCETRQQFSTGASDYGGPTTEIPAGAYIRLFAGRRGVTVGCPTSTEVRAHWSGWSQGKRRSGWDVTIDAVSFVALQYVLVGRGLLQQRQPPAG